MPSISIQRSLSKLRRQIKPALVLTALSAVAICAPLAFASQAHRGPVAQTAIIGGAPAQAGTFPSLAYVVDFQGTIAYQCTGTVIAPSLILTAGHCAENMQTGAPFSPSGYRVVIGAVEPLLPELPVSTVLGVIVYPGFNRRVDDGDVALLVLSTPTTAPPVKLASPSFAKHFAGGVPATIVGWGRTSYEQTSLTEQLQSAGTAVQGRRWCRRNALPFYARSEVCTITPPSYSTGLCEGDSGGPLLVSAPSGEPVELGVADHVYERCSTRRPSVFASVGALSSWIQSWVLAYERAPTPPNLSPPTTLPPGTSPQPAPS
jgi:secreted trypsin-like serine protease